MKDKLFDVFRNTIKTHGLLDDGGGVLIALSGGSDSVVMLHLFSRLREESGIRLEAVHINHMIRKTAGRDEAFCAALCEKYDIPLHIRRIDVPALSKERGMGLEECGREARYEAFSEIMKARGLNACATAHNRDDNAETMILNFIRGASGRGLRGIPYRRGDIIRPILDIKKSEVTAYAEECGLSFVTDETNADTAYTRNFVRHELIPMIERVNPSFSDTAARNAALFARDEAFLRDEAERVMKRGEDRGAYIVFGRGELSRLPEAVLSRVCALSCARVSGSEPDFTAVSRAMAAVYEKEGNFTETLSHGARLESAYGKIYFLKEIKPESFTVPLDKTEGELYFYGAGIKISYSVENYAHNLKKFNGFLYMDYDIISSEAFFTERREGDVFYPYGGAGKRSVKRFMQDEKIPAFLRARLPVLRAGGEVMWVCPVMRPARAAAVTDKTKRVILFKVSPAGKNQHG